MNMTIADIVIHPTVTMRKYTEDGHEPTLGWTAEYAYEGLKRRLPDTNIVLGTQDQFGSGTFAQARVLLAGRVNRPLLEKMPKLEWLQFGGSGADHFFKASGLWPDDFKGLGIRVLNSPGVSRYPVSEHVLAMMLALARGVPRALRQQIKREWTIFPVDEMRGKTLGVLGLGEIGERVAALGRAFGMHVVGTKRDPARHGGNAHVVVGSDRAAGVIAASDYLVLLTPLSDQTRNSFNYQTFKSMKRGSYFINVSRGENVVEDDLVRALKEGLIAGAAVDTFGPIEFDNPKKQEALRPESALWDIPNMLVIPNNAASTGRYMDYFVDAVVDNYTRWRAGQPFRSVVA
jgi:phosphoglycerate dehydrogenase-like enzyme